MNTKQAEDYIRALRQQTDPARWQNPLHVATNRFPSTLPSDLVIPGHGVKDAAMIEIFLSEKVPLIDSFYGIASANAQGIWFFDRESTLAEMAGHHALIAWRYISSVVVHETTPEGAAEE